MKTKLSFAVLCMLGVVCGCGSSLLFQVPDHAVPRYCSNPDDLPALQRASIEKEFYSAELIKCVDMVSLADDYESREMTRQALMAIAMKAKQEWNRREALKYLSAKEYYGPETSDFFGRVLQEDDVERKKIAIEYFAVKDYERVVPFLRSDDADLRWHAIEVLGNRLEGYWSEPSLVDALCRSLEGDMLLSDKMHVLNQLVEKGEEKSCTAPAVAAFLAEYDGSRWKDLPDPTFEKTRLLLDKAGYPTPEPRHRRDRTRSRPPCRGPSCSPPEQDML